MAEAAAVSTAAGCLKAPVDHLCGYVISYDSHVRKLKAKVAELGDARQNVEDSINVALNNVKPIKANVDKWMKDVEEDTKKAHRVLEDDERAKKTCFCRWLPNVRYRLGRQAKRKAEDIQGLINRKPSGDVYNNPPPGRVDGASNMISLAGDRGDIIFESRASILEDIMNALDDEKHKVIGIYGEGGVGKTTLLEQVEKKLRNEKRLFDMIVKADVSQNPDFKKIQDDIAYFLGLDTLKNEKSGQGRKDLLFQRLQNDPEEKVLIILDNLWKDLDLREVRIPSKAESKGCKLLLTSRFKDVLEQMECDTPIFHLTGLKDDEAFGLFEKTVGDRLKDDDRLEAIAIEVVKKLAGLPLLITFVACSLKDKDVGAWRIALKKIDRSRIETIVKLSYDHLKSENTKTLFLLCGLIGGTIHVEILLALGMGLGLFEDFGRTIQDSRDGLNTMVNELCSTCLLLYGGNDKNKVIIHDLYSEVVVSNAFSDQDSLIVKSNYGSWPKEELEKCWACLVNGGSDRLAELMLGRFRHVKILMLSEQYDMGDCSRMDFTYTEELRVLYLCSKHVTSLPSSMEILGNLQSLSIDCHVEDAANLGKLKALQILSFAMSTISRLPKEIGKLTNLRSLNLSHCYSLEIIEPGALKGLINLEELHMKGSFDQWMGKNEKPSELCNVGLAELRDMTMLNSLEISIRDPIVLLEVDDLPFENLTRFWINIGNAEGREFKGLRTMKIKLEGHDGILSKKWAQKTLQNTQYLLLDGLEESENAHMLCTQGFPQLKHLDIQDSPSVKYIASSSNSAFMVLESLFLNNLINLEKICHSLNHIATECLSKLKVVRVKECNRLKYLWCLSQMQNLVRLEEIEVRKCDSMRAIARKDIVLADYKVELPYLRHLDLARLPKMTSFCTIVDMTSEGAPIQAGIVHEGGGDEGIELETTTSNLQDTYSDSFFDRKVSLPNLEDLKFDSVGSFKRIWHDELSKSSFGKLATITVENCSDLLHIFPSTIIGRLHNLKNVNIKQCPSLKSLFDCGSLDSNTEQAMVLLPELVRINVESCPSLEWLFNCELLDSNAKHKIVSLPKLGVVRVSGAKRLRYMVMSHSQIVLGFPSLEIVSVENCSDLRYLFSNYTATTLVKLEWLEITICEQMKEVILDKEVGRLEVEVMSFPCLSTLILEELYNLISFGSGSCSYYFSSLKDLRIVRCCNFGAFIPSPTSVKRQLGKTVEENDESPQPLFNEMVTLPNIRSLNIEGVPCKELGNNHVPADSFSKLEFLLLKNCDNLQHIATSDMWKNLQRCLEKLEVISCHLIEIIYEGDGSDIECGELRRLVLLDLGNLRCIWQSDGLPNVPFPNLRKVTVVRCSRLEMLFPTFTMKFLGQIEKLVVESCENMELIAGNEKGEERTGTIVTFSRLNILRLFELPKFRRFLYEKYSLKFPRSEDFPSLEVLSIISCGAKPDQCTCDWEEFRSGRSLLKFYDNMLSYYG